MSTLSNDDKDLAQKLLIAGGVAVVVAGVAYGVYRFVSQRSKETPEEVFTRAFPSGKDQPIETVRKFFRALPRVDAVHLNFWLYIADQNSDGQISKEEFARVWRVASYNNKYASWEDDLRLMAFRVLDTDHDGVVDSEELSHGLGKLLALLGRKEKLDDIVAQLLPHKDDCLSDEEWVRSEIATRLINRETVKPLLL